MPKWNKEATIKSNSNMVKYEWSLTTFDHKKMHETGSFMLVETLTSSTGVKLPTIHGHVLKFWRGMCHKKLLTMIYWKHFTNVIQKPLYLPLRWHQHESQARASTPSVLGYSSYFLSWLRALQPRLSKFIRYDNLPYWFFLLNEFQITNFFSECLWNK